MTEDEIKDKEIDRFKMDLARFSGGYTSFMVIVRTPSGRLLWKSTDKTWAIGACHRYLNGANAWDAEEEKEAYEGKK